MRFYEKNVKTNIVQLCQILHGVNWIANVISLNKMICVPIPNVSVKNKMRLVEDNFCLKQSALEAKWLKF